METKLHQLKTDFNNIINIRTKVKGIFDNLQSRINKLKGLHAEFIKTSKTQMFIFGLDSFHFQSKLIDMEYDEMKRLFMAISNRMYCEYYKLYKIIVDYILSNKNDKTLANIKINNYPIYKDLEPYKEYNFEIIQDIHENILNLVNVLISTLNNKENEILLHKNKQSIGLNIDNFITTFNYSINVMKEKIIMFITYIEFFHKLHTKYFKRFSNKIQLMYSHINHDINFDDIKKTNSNDSNSKNSDEDTFSFDELKYNTESSNESDRESNSSKNSFSVNNKDEGTRSRTNSSISSNPNIETSSPKFKLKNKDKNLLEKNEKNEKNELDDLFSNIDISCDSIINKNKKEVLEEEITEITEIIETTEKMDIIENNISFNMNETQNNIQEDVMNEKLENITLQLLGYTPELIEPPLE
jgi:hypothetical protein